MEIYPIPTSAPVRIAVMPRPHGSGRLEDEIRTLRSAGVEVLVCLLTDEEVEELGLEGEQARSEANGIDYIAFPIPDREVPEPGPATEQFINQLAGILKSGKYVAIHCRMGIGRSALVAACALVVLGESVDAAFEEIFEARGWPVPDTEEQRAWVEQFAAARQTPGQGK